MTLSDSIVVMNNGMIEQTGTPAQVYEHPKNRFVASFLGKANFFGGKVQSAEGEQVTLKPNMAPHHPRPGWNARRASQLRRAPGEN